MNGTQSRRLAMAVAAVAIRARVARWFLRHRSLPVAAVVVALAVVAGTGIQTSAAWFSDATSTSSVQVAAGTVEAPTALALSDVSTAIRLGFTPPTSGIEPLEYDVFRRADGDPWPATPLEQPAGTPFDDATASECTTWWYRVRSRHTNLVSDFTGAESIRVDRSGPTVGEAHLYWTEVATPARDVVRTTPGGDVEVYADVSDNCTAQADLDVSFAFGAPFNTTVAATYSAVGWTPIAGGPTYHHRFTYDLPSGSVPNGQVVTWNVVASDEDGHVTTTAGTPFTGDGAGPTFQRAELVAAGTNFYDEGFGRGEIPSDGTARAAGSYVYADLVDPSGVTTVTSNLAVAGSVIDTGTTALPLAPGSFHTVAGTITWGWRSNAQVVNTGMGDGTRSFTVTAVDGVGNTTTSPNQLVEIDDTPPAAGTASCTNLGDNDGRLDDGDRTEWDLGDTIDPGSIAPGWTFGTRTATAVLRNGSRDYFDVNGDFGLTLFQGSAYNQAWNLNHNGWISTDATYPGSTITRADRSTILLTYRGGSVTDRNRQAQARIGTTVRDAAGNRVPTAFTEQCSTSPW